MYISSNTTPFLAEAFPALDKDCVKSLVTVVRATFDVDKDGTCRVSNVQSPFVYADAHYGDFATTSVCAESDFVPVKPQCDVLLDAVAMLPGERPAENVEVALIGPNLHKRAVVTGERYWTRTAFGVKPSSPTAFSTLPLAWHLAYGGTDDRDESAPCSDPRNPIGRGFLTNSRSGAIEGKPMPCVERAHALVERWDDHPEPIGFGPVPRFASDRARHAGTYDEHWMTEVLPFLPRDFDNRYFLAAPLDQQVESLPEGAVYGCVNMSITGSFRVSLPRMSVPVHFVFDDRIRVSTVTPDTVILVPHEARIVLLGRARAPLPRKLTRLREVKVGPHRFVVGPGPKGARR